MNPKILIRSETDADVDAIAEVTVAAFKTLEISNHTEQFIIAALRAAKALTISLVAEVPGRVVGHIAFSPLTISDGTRDWYGLGPVSVLPEYQRQGIGKALIQEGLSRLKAMNAKGCCLVGHMGEFFSGLLVWLCTPDVLKTNGISLCPRMRYWRLGRPAVPVGLVTMIIAELHGFRWQGACRCFRRIAAIGYCYDAPKIFTK